MLEMRIFVVYVLTVISFVNGSNTNVNQTVLPKATREQRYLDILEKCTEDNGITIEKYSYASEQNNINGTFDKSKCVDACMFKILEIMRPTGSINIHKALEHLLSQRPGVDQAKMRRNIEFCVSHKRANDCETAYHLMNCTLKSF